MPSSFPHGAHVNLAHLPPGPSMDLVILVKGAKERHAMDEVSVVPNLHGLDKVVDKKHGVFRR